MVCTHATDLGKGKLSVLSYFSKFVTLQEY